MLQLERKNSRWEEKGGGSAANCPYNGFPGLHQAISFSPASSLSGNTLHKYILAFYHFLFYVYIGCQYCVNNQFDNFALLSQMQVSGILTTTNNFFCGENITYLMFNLSINAYTELYENSIWSCSFFIIYQIFLQQVLFQSLISKTSVFAFCFRKKKNLN